MNCDTNNLMRERTLARYVCVEPVRAVEIYCSIRDYSGARKQGAEIPDCYRIRTVHNDGYISIRDVYSRDEANDAFKKIMRVSGGKWERKDFQKTFQKIIDNRDLM